MGDMSQEQNSQSTRLRKRKTKIGFPVVGLGASAGGLQALKRFFEGMPANSGMAFVVIMHLSPEHESHAAAILQNTTSMPVTQVNEQVKVEPDHVYVIPPTKHLAMEDGHIRLSEPKRTTGRHVAVDLFFRTLADTHQTRAVCIVLSGTGADGSVGVKRVKEGGGLAIAQDPQDAEYDAMPRNAINTGMIDFVLPVAEMPEKLIELWRNMQRIQLPVEAEAPVVDESQAAEHALRDVLANLRTRTGHDFTHYKRATVLRRIERRMQVNTTPDLPAYRDFLRATPAEAQLLLKDLLIGVTNFFRDRAAFDSFEREVVPLLFEGKTTGDVVRVWCAGCATGEEAYSVAMLLLEQAARMQYPPEIQVFATDIDEDAIAMARAGNYPEAIEADIAPMRLRQFFTKEPGGYCVNKEVRERILFATHNLIKDPPFSKLDAVTCRNLLIYLNREVQEQVFELFHFALRPGGFIFLGSSESTDGTPELFVPVNKKHRLFRAQVVARHARVAPALPLEASTRKERGGVAGGISPSDVMHERRRIAFGELHQQLVEQYAPPSLVVNAEYEIVHLSENAGRFLRLAGGEPSLNLMKAVLPELRVELRTALFQAMQTGRSTEARRVRLERDGHKVYVNMIVRPTRAAEGEMSYILVLFVESEETLDEEGREPPDSKQNAVVSGLEEESQRLRDQLQATVEQYETTVEELKSSNEEMQSINEELRSTGEELETSKEELQSVNEELRTVNQELKNKVEEVSDANDDLKNLMASTEIATVFLDRSLRIKRYTPRAADLFNLLPSDVGRPLADITHKLDYESLHRDADEVIASLHKIEREVAGRDGRHYIARLLPYRTTTDHIGGVVLNFVDITERARIEEALRKSERRLQWIVNVPRVGVLTFDYAGTMLHANDAFLEMVGYDREEFEAQTLTWRDFTPPDYLETSERTMQQLRETGRGGPYEKEYFRKDGSRIWLMFVAADLGDGTLVEYAVDISDRRKAEEALHASEEKYRKLFNSIDEGFCTIEVLFDEAGDKAIDYCFLEMNPAFARQTGIENGVGRTMREIVPEYEEFWFETYGRIARTGEPARFEHEAAALGKYFDVYCFRIGEPQENRIAILFNDILARRQAEERLRESEERFRLFVTAASEIIYRMSADWSEMRLLEGRNFLADTRDPSLTWLEEYIPENDRSAVRAAIAEAARAKTTFELEHRVIRADESIGWVFSRAIPFLDERGEITGWFGAASDITERKRTEANLAFLAEVSQELARLTNIDETLDALGAKIGRFFSVKQCIFAECTEEFETAVVSYGWNAEDARSLKGTYRMRDFFSDELMAAIMKGEVFAVSETQADVRVSAESYGALGIRSFIIVPLVRERGWQFQLSIIDDKPRNWREDEINLMREITTRIWMGLERARAEEALRASEARRHLALDAAKMGTFLYHPQEDRGEPDARMLRLFGLEPGATLNLAEALDKMIHPDDREIYAAEVARAVDPNGDGKLDAEIRVIHPDESVHWIVVTAQVIFEGEPPQASQMYGIAADITSRKRAEDLLRESEERFRAMYEQANVGIVQIAFDGRLLRVNPGFCKIVGYADGECRNLTVKAVTHPDDYEAEMIETRRLLAGEINGFSMEKRYVQQGGAIVWGQMTTALVRKELGEPFYLLAIIEDITERKCAEVELKKINQQLEGRVQERTIELMQMNSDLQAEITERKRAEQERAQILRRLVMTQEDERRRIARDMHDQFGQQLTALLLKLGMLKEDCGTQAQLCEQVEALETVARQLDRDVDFLVWELRPTALDDLGLRDALDNYARSWSRHFNIPIDLQLNGMRDERLTSEIETVLYRIAQEALNNVAKHARASSVDLVLNRRNDHVSLIVEDNGVGFDPGVLSGAGDQGLGLVGMRERAALVGGTVLIESRPGDGVTIIVRIPVSRSGEKGEKG